MKLVSDKKRIGSLAMALSFAANLSLYPAIAQNQQAQQVYVPPTKYQRTKQYALAGMQTAQSPGIPLAMSGIPYGVNPTLNVPSATWRAPSANVASYTACDSVAHTQATKLVKLGKLDHARQVILTGLRSHPGDQRLRKDLLDIDLKRAKYLNSQKQFDAATSALREGLYWVSTSTVALSMLNSILVVQGINASDAAARLRLADVFAGQNKNTDAFVEYRISANITATAAAYIGLGNIAYRFGEMKEAKGFYGQAVSLEPNLAATHRQLGLFDLAINDLVGANSELSRALILDPTDQTSARSLVGLWQRQVSMNTNDVNNHLGLARAYLLVGDLKSAQQEYRQVVLIDPQNPQLPAARMGFKLAISRQEVARAFDAARGFESQGNFSAALQSVQSALRIEPNNIQLLNYDGSLWEKMGRFENARSAYLAVLKQDQANTYAIQRLNALATAGGIDAAKVASSSGLGIAAASAGGAALGAALPAIMSPPPVAKIGTDEEVNSIAGLLGHVRTVAAGEKMRITKGENTVQSLMQLMEKLNSGKSSGSGGLNLSALFGGGGADTAAASMGSGLPPGVSALLGAGPAGSSVPNGLSALLDSIGGASGLAALLGGAGKRTVGSNGLPPAIADLMRGDKSPAGSGLPSAIADLLHGSQSSAGVDSALAGLPPNIQAIVNGTQPPAKPAASSITAGVPASVAAILGAVPVPAAAATSELASTSARKTSGSKSVSARKVETTKGKTSVKKATVKSAPKVASSSGVSAATEAVAAGTGAALGGGLAGYMPLIQMAMERFTALEQQTKTMQQQLEEARQQLQVLQSRPCVTPCGGNYSPPNLQAPPGFLPMTPQLDMAQPLNPALPSSSSLPVAGEVGAAALGTAIPAINSPTFSSAASTSSADGSDTSKKKEKQNKIRLELEGVRPDILGLRFKVVLKNDENHSIPVPADPNAIIRKLKVSFPATSVPAHGELHGNIKFSIP
ncbi:MAG: hypothetical protein K2Y22_07695 [Candidatus Obscuribacterales bacterium]|nr:hypothetical protein [Candidatus Obscuribacterales bacterium]